MNEPTLIPLSQSQRLFLAGQLLSPASPMYNMAMIISLPPELDVARFCRAYRSLLERSDAMRLRLVDGPDGPAWEVAPADGEPDLEIATTDYADDPDHWEARRTATPTDLTGRLYDCALIPNADQGYYFFLKQHHLITDAWGKTEQWRILAEAYDELGRGAEKGSTPSYADYLLELAQSPIERARAYWQEALHRLPPQPVFNQNRNFGRVTESRRHAVTLSDATRRGLNVLTDLPEVRSFSRDLTLLNLFLTALAATVYKTTGQEKFTVATPAHNRLTLDQKRTPGLFIELFPMVAEVLTADTYLDVYQRTRAAVMEQLRHARPGASSAELAGKSNVVLNYINAGYGAFGDHQPTVRWLHPGAADPGHHVRLQVVDYRGSGEFQLFLDLNAAVFPASAAKRFVGVLEATLESMAQDIRHPLTGTAGVEEATLFTPPLSSDPPPLPLAEIDGHFISAPSAVAIDGPMGRLTYAELDRHSRQLAHYLRSAGVGEGTLVPIHLPRSPQYVVAVLGVLRAGGAFVPVPVDYASGRVLGIIEECASPVVLTDSVIAAALPKRPAGILELDTEAAFLAAQPTSEPEAIPGAEDLAYVIYTSGSTGRPKGVMIQHGALAEYLATCKARYAAGGREKIVAPLFTSLGFDLTITSLFLPLTTGGTVIPYARTSAGADLALLDVLADNRVNFLKLTPSHLGLLSGKSFPDSKVRWMLVGGEAFKTQLARRVSAAFPASLKIVNEYGPTEATVGCISYVYEDDGTSSNSTERNEYGQLGEPAGAAVAVSRLRRDATVDEPRPQRDATVDELHQRRDATVAIGRAMPGFHLALLDQDGKPVHPGRAGELYLAGPALASGYYQRPDLTEQAFVRLPQLGDDRRWYRTGDLARLDPDSGDLYFEGRVDEQVKINGRRVELGEIESLAERFPGLRAAVVDRRSRRRSQATAEVVNCRRCGLPSNYPGVTFNAEQVCSLCTGFAAYQRKIERYFKTPADLEALLQPGKREGRGDYDCLLLLSGGKDSTYALAKLKEMGLRILAFTLDNGYISEGAKDNVRRTIAQLGVDHVFGQTEAMNAIFTDSLQRHCNVCDGCFKTIYTLSTRLALDKNIPFIITGLSRGQFFETRLTEELFNSERIDVEEIDRIILNARKAYHRVPDAVSEHLDVAMFEDDATFERVQYVDFYRYTDVSLAEMLDYLNNDVGWVRPADTGRSTNCLINQAGIYVHKKELGYSNYAFPYSWDVRVGHKTREASLEEINEYIDEEESLRMLDEIGYLEVARRRDERPSLVAYYVADAPIDESALRAHLRRELPEYMVPVQFIALDAIPLTTNGKVDRDALPRPDAVRPVTDTELVAPRNEFEEIILGIWSEVLGVDRLGVLDEFLDVGGDSLAGIRIVSRLNETLEMDLPVMSVFEHATVERLAAYVMETMERLLGEMNA